MEINSDFRDLLRTFVDGGVRFLIVGAYAVMHHTVPRYTKDLDLWVEPTGANATRVLRALAAFGAPIGGLTVDDLSSPDIVYQIGVAPVRVDILTGVGGLSFRAAYGHAIRTSYGGVPVRVLSFEDIILAKQATKRPQDRLDLRRLLATRKRGQPRRRQ